MIVFIFLSCKNDTKEFIQYDKDRKIVSKIYGNSKKSLDSIIYFKNGIIDSKMIVNPKNKFSFYVKYYDSIGVSSEGNTLNKIKIGKWKYYDSKKRIRKIVEFKNICGEEYPNQEWNYNDQGDLKMSISTYYKYKFKSQMFKKGETNILMISYVPMTKKDPICTINFSNKIDSTFCNVDMVEKVAFRSSDLITFTVPMMLDEIGKHNFRGYIEEHEFEEIKNSTISNHITRRIYIDIPFKVK